MTTPGREWYHGVYLKSEHWKATRARAIELAGKKCSRCRKSAGALLDVPGVRFGVCIHLEVHHRTYERLWFERDSDLEVLCQLCHRYQHGTESDFQRHAMHMVERQTRLQSRESILQEVWGDEDL